MRCNHNLVSRTAPTRGIPQTDVKVSKLPRHVRVSSLVVRGAWSEKSENDGDDTCEYSDEGPSQGLFPTSAISSCLVVAISLRIPLLNMHLFDWMTNATVGNLSVLPGCF